MSFGLSRSSSCHISIFIAIIKLNNIMIIFPDWSEDGFAGFELRQFRKVRRHCLVSGRSKKIVADEDSASRRIFVVRATSNGILGPDDEESLSSGRHRTRPKSKFAFFQPCME